MNSKQKSILAGRKPKPPQAEEPHSGPSPLASVMKYLWALDAIYEAQWRWFQLTAMPMLEERIKQKHPNCICYWEDVQPVDPVEVRP